MISSYSLKAGIDCLQGWWEIGGFFGLDVHPWLLWLKYEEVVLLSPRIMVQWENGYIWKVYLLLEGPIFDLRDCGRKLWENFNTLIGWCWLVENNPFLVGEGFIGEMQGGLDYLGPRWDSYMFADGWRKKTHQPYNYFLPSTWIQDNQLYFNCIHPFQEFAVKIIRFFQLGKSSRFPKTMKCTSLWWSRWLNFLQVCGGHGLGDEWRRSSRAFVGHGLYDLGAIGCIAGVRSLGSRSDFSSLLNTSYIM